MPYEEYVERHIFQPLGMTHSTFRQPLPAQFGPFMAQGYPRASAEAKPYVLVGPAGAGGSAMSTPVYAAVPATASTSTALCGLCPARMSARSSR